MGGSQLAADIRAAGSVLRGVLSGLQPKDVPLPFAPDVLAAFVEVQRLAESGRMLMTARAAEAGERGQRVRARGRVDDDFAAGPAGEVKGHEDQRPDGEAGPNEAGREGTAQERQQGEAQGAAEADGFASGPEGETRQGEGLDLIEREALVVFLDAAREDGDEETTVEPEFGGAEEVGLANEPAGGHQARPCWME